MSARSLSTNAAAAALICLSSLLVGQARAAPAVCGAVAPLQLGGSPVPVIKVYTGADGVSHIERTEIKGFAVPFFNSGGVLTQTVLGPSLKVVVVQGPPSTEIPVRKGIGAGDVPDPSGLHHRRFAERRGSDGFAW